MSCQYHQFSLVEDETFDAWSSSKHFDHWAVKNELHVSDRITWVVSCIICQVKVASICTILQILYTSLRPLQGLFLVRSSRCYTLHRMLGVVCVCETEWLRSCKFHVVDTPLIYDNFWYDVDNMDMKQLSQYQMIRCIRSWENRASVFCFFFSRNKCNFFKFIAPIRCASYHCLWRTWFENISTYHSCGIKLPRCWNGVYPQNRSLSGMSLYCEKKFVYYYFCKFAHISRIM